MLNVIKISLEFVEISGEEKLILEYRPKSYKHMDLRNKLTLVLYDKIKMTSDPE
jgi:hypothetical protein